MQTAVVFDCESDRLFERSERPPRVTSKTEEEERQEEIFRMECTVVCALVLPVDEVRAIANVKPNDAADQRAQRLIEQAVDRVICWRDRSGIDAAGSITPPFEPLLAAFDSAAVIVGYNQLGFDMPLLRKYYNRDMKRYTAHRLKCLDPFVIVRSLTDEWIGLNALLVANGLSPKTGHGKGAVELWDAVQMASPEQARSARAELEKYCVADVERTARLVLLPTLQIPSKVPLELPNACCGLASRLAAVQLSDSLGCRVGCEQLAS